MSARARVMLGLVALAAVLVAVLLGRCRLADSQRTPAAAEYRGPVSVWVVDDGARIASAAGSHPAMRGEGNPLWSPGDRAL